MYSLTIERFNNNDDGCLLVAWLFEEAQVVPAEQPVALVETSKATEEVLSHESGILHRLLEASTACQFGQVIGYLFASEEERQQFLTNHSPQEDQGETQEESSPFVITRAAQELIAQHQITLAQLRSLHKHTLKKSDIESLLQPELTKKVYQLSRTQQAVAQIITTSHRSIPAAFTLVKIVACAAESIQQQVQAQEEGVIGLVEIAIKVLARVCELHPLMLGSFQQDGTVLCSDQTNIGITIDVGNGLYIPVIKGARAKSLTEIADLLMEFRVKALRGNFKEDDFKDGNISLALNHEPGILFAQPIIFPSQTCMFSLGAMHEELFLSEGQKLAMRPYFHLGLAYDHRVLNGREVMHFLGEVKTLLESFEHLQEIIAEIGGRI